MTEVLQAPEVQELIMHFPEADQNTSKAFDRPHGKVKVMIGIALTSLNCKDGHKAGELCLKKSIFFHGWMLTGPAPKCKGTACRAWRKTRALEQRR